MVQTKEQRVESNRRYREKNAGAWKKGGKHAPTAQTIIKKTAKARTTAGKAISKAHNDRNNPRWNPINNKKWNPINNPITNKKWNSINNPLNNPIRSAIRKAARNAAARAWYAQNGYADCCLTEEMIQSIVEVECTKLRELIPGEAPTSFDVSEHCAIYVYSSCK